MVPAPERGGYVRLLANALRDYKDPLGSLVAYEMGKIKAEGDGEVQEMIDVADFAVGLSRQLYGLTMGSERPRHRMYEQWHPLGPVGVYTVNYRVTSADGHVVSGSWPFHLRTPGTGTPGPPAAAPGSGADHVPWWPFLAAGSAIVLAAALWLARRPS